MALARRTRIFIADDSAVMRRLLRSVIASDPRLEVAGTAVDGETALAAIHDLRPDLVLLDVEMPVMDGLVMLRSLRERGHGMPVIMCSSLTQRGARVTIEALAAGASDYVAKPCGQVTPTAAMQALALELLPRIHALASIAARGSFDPAGRFPQAGEAALSQSWSEAAVSSPSIIVIGVSTGGPAALDVLLGGLPASFPLPVLVVQHMPRVFTGYLAERLNACCDLEVREAAEGDPVLAGKVSIARGDWHLEVLAGASAGQPARLHLTQAAPENHCRPAVDVLLRSAAAAYGSGVLAVVLTGMGSDGVAGCRMVRARGGTVFAQDRATSAVWGMPGAVVGAGLAHRVFPIEEMAGEIVQLARGAPRTGQNGRVRAGGSREAGVFQ
jgi:two-component system, chemotaxis family, protein-glutamate methylesterase/glutaminase